MRQDRKSNLKTASMAHTMSDLLWFFVVVGSDLVVSYTTDWCPKRFPCVQPDGALPSAAQQIQRLRRKKKLEHCKTQRKKHNKTTKAELCFVFVLCVKISQNYSVANLAMLCNLSTANNNGGGLDF